MEMHSRMNDEKRCGVGGKHQRPATLHYVRQPSKHVATKYHSHASTIIVRCKIQLYRSDLQADPWLMIIK